MWYVEDHFYIQLIELLAQVIPDTHDIRVCTQGNAGWLQLSAKTTSLIEDRLFISTTNQLFINDNEVKDFILMKNAEILFSAGSWFSAWATFLGEQKLVIDISRMPLKAPLLGVTNVNPDSNLHESLNEIANSISLVLWGSSYC